MGCAAGGAGEFVSRCVNADEPDISTSQFVDTKVGFAALVVSETEDDVVEGMVASLDKVRSSA